MATKENTRVLKRTYIEYNNFYIFFCVVLNIIDVSLFVK